VDLQKKKDLVKSFLVKCNAYADRQLAKYAAEAESATGLDALKIHDQIHHWTTYKAFNEYTVAELGTDELDHWFD